jgi:hypothetical protein
MPLTKYNLKIKQLIMNTLLKYGTYCMIAMAACFLLSCSDDDQTFDITGDTENRVYINTWTSNPPVLPTNGFLFNVTVTPAGSTVTNTSKIEAKFPVQCTKPAVDDIYVNLAVDNSLIVEGYSVLPDGISITLDKTGLVIPKGANISTDSITVSVDGNLQLLHTGNYVVPIKISSVSGNAQLSSNLSAAYVVVNSMFTNTANNGTTLPGGTAITPKSTWTATGIASYPERLFDASTSTASYASTGAVTPPFTIEIDMKTDYAAITGFRVAYSSNSYCITRAIIYTRTNIGDYEFQGDVTLTRATSQVVRFYQPVNAQFIKLEIQTVYSNSYGLRLTDFNAYR